MVSVGRNGTVLYMNEAARRLVGERVKNIDRLFDQMPPRAGTLNAIRAAQGQVMCFLAERELPGARREMILVPAAEAVSCETGRTAKGVASGPVLHDPARGWNDVEALPVPC